MKERVTAIIVWCDQPYCGEHVLTVASLPEGWQQIKATVFGAPDQEYCPKHRRKE